MSDLQLICITDQTEAVVRDALQKQWVKQNLLCVSEGQLTAVLKQKSKSGFFDNLNKKKQLKELIEWQKLLEQCLHFGSLLPGGGKALLQNTQEAQSLLKTHTQDLKANIEHFGKAIQFQITIYWDPEAVLRHAKDDGSILKLDGPELFANADPMKTAESIQRQMEAYKKEKASTFFEQLSSCSKDSIQLPCDHPDMILNMVVLIERKDELTLDHIVQGIDETMPDQLTIKYVGPLPAISFASVGVLRSSPQDLEYACQLLGISHPAKAQDIRYAYLNYMKEHHPDVAVANPDEGEGAHSVNSAALTEVNNAYQLLMRVAKKEGKLTSISEKESNRVFIELFRENDLQRAA